MHNQTRRMVTTALLIAMICTATMVVKIPSPTQGYVNLGDCMVLLSGWLLGPLYGTVAGGVGTALADLLSGYPHYVPGGLLIKGLMALICALAARGGGTFLRRALSGLTAECVMILGYFGYSSLILGKGLAAAASIPGNLFQGAAGLAAGLALYEALAKSRSIEHLRKAGLCV
ncbi:MAG: ECF transporter S component [Oscillospiraceae bacterium]|nr:ECF transporter S component [Oscillospiraceae bacterium]